MQTKNRKKHGTRNTFDVLLIISPASAAVLENATYCSAVLAPLNHFGQADINEVSSGVNIFSFTSPSTLK
jgi:hypothetical protein